MRQLPTVLIGLHGRRVAAVVAVAVAGAAARGRSVASRLPRGLVVAGAAAADRHHHQRQHQRPIAAARRILRLLDELDQRLERDVPAERVAAAGQLLLPVQPEVAPVDADASSTPTRLSGLSNPGPGSPTLPVAVTACVWP